VSHLLLRGSPFTFGTVIRRRLLTVGTVIISFVFLVQLSLSLLSLIVCKLLVYGTPVCIINRLEYNISFTELDRPQIPGNSFYLIRHLLL
jgi:hypothetical protein